MTQSMKDEVRAPDGRPSNPAIELLLLIVRRRKMVLAFTFLSICVSLVILLKPRVAIVPEASYTITERFIVAQIPSDLRRELSFDVLSMARTKAMSVSILEKGIGEYRLKVPADVSFDSRDQRLTSYVVGDFLAKAYSASIDGATQILTISLKAQDPAIGTAFLDYIGNAADQALRALVAERSAIIAEEMEIIVADKRLLAASRENVLRTLAASKLYSPGNIPILAPLQEEPIITIADAKSDTTGQPPYRKAILMTLTGFLVGVATAWLAESIHRLLHDEVFLAAMRKALSNKKIVR